MLVDTHAHLFLPNFENDVDEVLKRAAEENIKYIIIPATDIETSRQAIHLAEKYEPVFAAVGVHPHDTKDWDNTWIAEIEKLASNPKVVAIGEIGLDYYYDFSPKELQIKALKAQLDLALKINLPVVIHNREANEDIMEIFREYSSTELRAQFHCFAGTAEEARELIRMGHYVSFTGNITFKKADSLRAIAASIEIDNMFIETDSPFLTPVPYRGKRNEPANVKLVAEKLAEIKHLSFEDVARSTSYNVHKFFGIGDKPKLSYTYQIGNSLYVNVTNRCNADCVFCDRKGEAVVKGYNLKMAKSEEPDAEVYIEQIGDPNKYNEIVFCGYGEPTIRWEVVKLIAKYVKDKGGKTRLNTDGHGNFIQKKDITPELENLIDVVSISLNSTNSKQYAKLMQVDEKLHAEMLNFAEKAKNYSKVVLSIVGLDEVDKEEAKILATEKLGVNFRERDFF